MFGGGRKNDKDNKKDGDKSLSSVMAPEGPKKGSSSITGFDPEGLERAAKAARDLDSSKNAGSAIELIKSQELTKQVSYLYMIMILWWGDLI
jgi:ATPase family AAA domain-containing protein 3A/B